MASKACCNGVLCNFILDALMNGGGDPWPLSAVYNYTTHTLRVDIEIYLCISVADIDSFFF